MNSFMPSYENLNKMDHFLEKWFAKMNSRKMEKLNKPIKESKSIVNLLMKTKLRTPGPDSLRDNSVLYKLVQKIEKKGKLLNSFYDTSKLLKEMPDENSKRNENYGPISLMSNRKILSQTLANQKIIPHDQEDHILVIQV